MKIQKTLLFLFIFIIILFIPGTVFCSDGQNGFFEGIFYSDFWNGNLDPKEDVPDISNFDTIEELKKFELNKPQLFVRHTGVSPAFESAYFTLLYLNEKTGQAVFDYEFVQNTSAYTTNLNDFTANFYFLDEEKGIFQEITYHTGYSGNAIVLNLNENGFIDRIHLFENTSNFVFNSENTSQCGFVTRFNSAQPYYEYDYVLQEDNTFIWQYISGYNEYNKILTWFDYTDKNKIYLIPPIWVSYMNYLAYNSYNTLTLDQVNEFNFYYSSSDNIWGINSFSDSIYTSYIDYTKPILYSRNENIIKEITKDLTESVFLYIDDFNLKKRFQFNLHIPLKNENTKYYLFLQDYLRTDYNNTTGLFKVVTIDLPEDFDSTGYYNYLYFDNLLKKYIAPAGAEIKIYDCSVDSGSVGECTLIKEYIGTRDAIILNEEFSLTYAVLNGFISADNYATHFQLDTLIPTDKKTNNNYLTGILADALLFSQNENGESSFTQTEILRFLGLENIHDFIYKYALKIFYYDNNFIDIYDNFIGGNSNVISYENSTNGYNNQEIYSLFRKTNVYSQENRLDSISYFFNYIDNEDVSIMLPEDVDNTYLNSSFFINNPNSDSGGYITYNIINIYGYNDYIINYGKDTNSIRDLPETNYIDNFEVGNDIILNGDNNVNINVINKTSNEISILNNIYTTLLRIEKKIGNISNNVINNVDNITNTTKNYFTILFIPDFNNLQEDFEEITDTAEEHLGFLYQPFIFITFFFESISDINGDEIVFHSPPISIMGYEVLPEMYFDFNEQLFNINETWQNIRSIQLLICDFVLVSWFINFMIKIYGEVFKNDN